MAFDPKTGQYKPDSPTGAVSNAASVSQRLTGLMSQQNPLMQQARTQGLQSANRRGLMNSSMGVQAAQTAQLGAALPIASQEAQQANQRIIQGRDIASTERRTQMDIAARERQAAASMAAEFDRTYSQQIATIMNNEKIPASARQDYFAHAGRVRDSNLRLVEQMYGIDLNWGTPHAGGSGGAQQKAIDSAMKTEAVKRREREQVTQKQVAQDADLRRYNQLAATNGWMPRY